MISSFGILHSLYLRSLSISAVWLSVHCVNHWSWFEAKECCQSIGKSLGTPPNTADSVWSFYYTRRSHWIAALGCASSLNGKTYKNFSMQIPSAGLCQELCVEKLVNITVFIVQNETCICSTDNHLDLHLHTNHCKFDCINDMNSTQSYNKNSCGKTTEPTAYSVFLSRKIHEEDWATLNASCIAVYRNNTKSTNDQLQVKIVEEERYESCTTSFNLLLKGINSAAKRSKTNPLVFRRQTYISHDREYVNFSDFEKTNMILSCQLCENGGCTFTDCNVKANNSVCSNGHFISNLTSASLPTKTNESLLKTTAIVDNYSKSLELSSLLSTTVIQKPNVTTHPLGSFSQEPTSTQSFDEITNATTHTLGSFSQEPTSTQSFDEITKKGGIMKNYGIVATSFLICMILLGIIVFIIRKKQIVSKRKGPSTLYTRERGSNKNERKRGDGTLVPKSGLYEFADNSKLEELEEQTHYNQENEDMYNHLRERVPTNTANDDTYMVARYKTSREDNVYLGRMEDPYDHLIRADRTRQEDDTYYHAPNVGEPSYSSFNINVGRDTSQSHVEESIYDHFEG